MDLSSVARAGFAASEGGNITRLIAQRNAVSVFPDPVGARISVDSPRAIAGHPSVCGGVGASNDARNQSPTASWKRSRTAARFATFLLSLYLFRPTELLYPWDMGDSGEGLVDAEARIAERMEEREADRRRSAGGSIPVVDPEKVREKESLKLARAELTRQAAATTHPVRKKQIDAALAEIERRLATV